MKNEELTGKIIGAAINVHKALGPGFLESVYEESLALEFDALESNTSDKKSFPSFYCSSQVGEHRLDFLVEKLVVVELKAVIALDKIFFATVRSYLKATNLESGLLFNFAAMPLTIKRIGVEDLNYLVSDS